LNTKPDGTRSVERPKLRWEDGVAQDTQILEVKRWKNAALNRDEWAKLLKKARVHQGLSSQYDDDEPAGTSRACPDLYRNCFTLFSTFTYFEQAYCSSSGGTTLYVQQLVYVMR